MSISPDEQRLTMDLEEQLKEDTDGTLKKNLQAEFEQQISKIESELKKGAAPDEYKRLDTIKQGLQSAAIVLERVWLYHHQGK